VKVSSEKRFALMQCISTAKAHHSWITGFQEFEQDAGGLIQLDVQYIAFAGGTSSPPKVWRNPHDYWSNPTSVPEQFLPEHSCAGGS